MVWPRSICLSDFASQKSSKKRSRCASPKLSDFASLHDGPAPTRSKSRRSSKDPVESVAHSKSRRSKDPVESIEELSGPRLHAPKRDGKVDQAAVGTWTCNMCQQSFQGTTRQFAVFRYRHRAKWHPEVPTRLISQRHHLISSFVEVSDIQMHLRSWTCSKCKLGLPIGLKYTARRNTAIKHLQKCFRKKPISFGENASRLAKRGLSRTGAGKAPLPLTEYGKEHVWVELHHNKRFKNQTKQFCKDCAVNKGKFTHGHCPGQCEKLHHLKKKWRQWVFLRKNHSDDIAEWIQIWNLSRYDVLELDKVALRRGNLSRKALPPLTKSTWWRDLCADGDVEPNPGPLHGHLRLGFLNANGYDNCWASLSYMADNFGVFGLVETHTNTWQCSKVAAKLQAEGFRVWSIAATEHRDIRGRTNFSGGIIAAVRANRKGFHFDELQGEDGSLIILDLQHCILGFAWARNGLTADSELAQCIFDAQCLAHIQNIPWVMVGDWNLLPHQNPLLDPGTAWWQQLMNLGSYFPHVGRTWTVQKTAMHRLFVG